MPCKDYGIEEYYQSLEPRCQALSKLLCEACSLIESGKTGTISMSACLDVWWKKHQRGEAGRVRDNELTTQERHALGIP